MIHLTTKTDKKEVIDQSNGFIKHKKKSRKAQSYYHNPYGG